MLVPMSLSHGSTGCSGMRLRFCGGAVAALCAVSAAFGCGGSSSGDSTASNAGAAGSAAGGGMSHGGSTSSAGADSGGSSASGASHSGGSSGNGGSHSGGSNNAGSGGSGGSCANLTTLADCKAHTGCNAIYRTLECPGSGAPCPTEFAYCSSTGCGPECSSGSICVSQQVSGGATIESNDAGACPADTHATSGGRCDRDPSYACAVIPASCGATVDCACASSVCQGCQSVAAGQVNCVELVP